MNRNVSSKLLILGNGFDKSCKLKSSFSDYYEANLKDDIESYINAVINDKDSFVNIFNKDEANNFWVLLFSLQYHFENKWKWKDISTDDWNDIETLVCTVLTKKDNSNKYIFDYFKLAKQHGITSDLKQINSYWRASINSNVRNNPIVTYLRFDGRDKEDIVEYLYNQLREFEYYFSKYLDDQINSHPKYEDFKNHFLKELVENEAWLINFNYSKVNNDTYIEHEYNIHGEINNETIIGIDLTAIDKDSESYKKYPSIEKFTKTWRQLHRESESIVLPDNINKIVFYGHSLGEQDFSYFYSLFDTYHLYDSEIKLEFCYLEYGGNTQSNNKIHEKYVNAVYKLINKYSENSRNDANLLNRLIIEGRIKIRKLEGCSIVSS